MNLSVKRWALGVERSCSRPRRLLLFGAAGVLAAACAWWCIPRYAGNLDDYGQGVRIEDRQGRVLRQALGPDDQLCRPITVAEAGPRVVQALVAAEDKRFFRHGGVDPLAVLRACWQNLVGLRRVSGASTLTTLVVKMTEPRSRTLWTKVVEAHHARDVEARLDKEAILAQFLNRAPFGGNLQGLDAASRAYFGRAPRDLTLGETALLVGLPQAPSRLRPDRHYAAALERRDYVLERMEACGAVTAAEAARARRERPVLQGGAQPFAAPHFCDLLVQQYPGDRRLRSTLDPACQAVAESVLRARVAALAPQGVCGGAVVILDVPRCAVRAMVGSPDFFDRRAAGQVNAAVARRSPGSTLKPFIYALAFDQGLATPATVVGDVPTPFADYHPRNFDEAYRGPVSLHAALVQSLNIPALVLARDLGLESVVGRLRALGLRTLDQPAAQYGLSVALGTCEVTLLDLANAYACLAREGVYAPARLLEREPVPEGRALYSPEAAWLVSDILSGEERAQDVNGHRAAVESLKVAWKTGTSTGFRDAWTVAYNPDYVVAVWLGNPDGRAAPVLVGASVAAPAAYEIFRRLYPRGGAPWYARPAGVQERRVCAGSGVPPGPHCGATATDLAIAGVSAGHVCTVHRPAPDGGVAEVWPQALAAFIKAQGGAGAGGDPAAPPPALRISAPVNGTTLRRLEERADLRQELKLALAPAPVTRPVCWFVDGRFLARATSDQPVFWPLQAGRHRIACATPTGQRDAVSVVVE